MTPRARILLPALIAFAVPVVIASAQQKADPNFKASVSDPAYKTSHPRVLFDEAHHNFHTAGGRYKPFAELITSDGCKVEPGTKPFSQETLKQADVLIIANALGHERMGSAKAARPAFTPQECEAVENWVREGGALLLITDHYPTGSAADILGRKFGVDMSRGVTEEYTFTKEGGLGDHPILEGRSESERVRRVGTFTGQSLKGPPGSTALLSLPDDAKEQVPDPKDPHENEPLTRSAKGRCQALALRHGKGRVVILGEAAMMTAQLGPDGRPFGMNIPGIDNRQFALNILHWLTGLLDADPPARKPSK